MTVTGPLISVIIAAYNAMPYLTRCVESVAAQSIGKAALEVIVVDDGSTDGTPAELKRLGAAHPGLLRVVTQENSGGPAGPRNHGLDLARGEFVFFLDADDHLGPEALERMAVMAEKNGTDVVLGKMVGEGGRRPPQSMFRRNQPRTDVFDSRVYWTLSPMKLFRRSLVEEHHLRFPTDLPTGEDQPFVARAYLHASGISVVADYDCVYWVLRADEGNITLRTPGSEPRLRFLSRMVDLLVDRVPPGPGRDHLAHRHLTVEVGSLIRCHLVHEPRDEQHKTLARLAETLAPLWHDGLHDVLPPLARLRMHLVRHTMLDELLELDRYERELAESGVSAPLLVEDGRAYVRHPFLRDPGRGVPDACYDVTALLSARHHLTRAELRGTTLHLAGHAYLHRVATHDVATELVLRERGTGTEFRLPVTHTDTPGLGDDEDKGRYPYERAGFEASVDVTTAAEGGPLDDGLWDVSLDVAAQGLSKEVRIGCKRADDVDAEPCVRVVDTPAGPRALALYTTKPYGNFTLDLGENKHRVTPRLLVDGVRWARDVPNRLEFSGRCSLASYPDDALRIVLSEEGGRTAAFPVPRGEEGRTGGPFTVGVPVERLGAGVWTGELRLGAWGLPLPQLPPSTAPVKWRRLGLPWYAKPAQRKGRCFALHVARTDLVKAFTRRLGL
ncbi:glycosyltransferase [Streptomyces sp. NPDC008150]|uniref:glycosyltransferase family 2 protein n=1 Tax=Streptomyces sp. NPDC008150 TaxID=3364816 RepID=UPI0036E5D33F